ncbi:MAG: DUF6710 family protein [Campylobacterota bacterium]
MFLTRLKTRFTNCFFPNKQQIKRFEAIMNLAYKINDHDPRGLEDYIKLLARQYQSKIMLKVTTRQRLDNFFDFNDLFFDQFIPINTFNERLFDLKKPLPSSTPLRLGSDIIFTQPWNDDSMSRIFTGIQLGQWQQDSNHIVEYWYPVHIGWTNQGNHSITNGIIKCHGEIKEYAAFDISEIYKYVDTDGVYFYRIDNKKKIAKVPNVEIAAIFEIGRIISKSCQQ